jgi:hypothetical protein
MQALRIALRLHTTEQRRHTDMSGRNRLNKLHADKKKECDANDSYDEAALRVGSGHRNSPLIEDKKT